ncbi:MAG: ShlB/FhaC/HecB family hemolysin secretion/activation protein [Pseudomonadales bacterium]|nr:ShlB/FhaC/HecB family hemolysin secretion/activation protein [Pseudomonadales bacterium]
MYLLRMFNKFRGLTLFVLLALPLVSYAGFFDMPDITEVPELEPKSMLRDMDIPTVRQRNPNPKSGPRLAISEFRLQGIVEFPELGITLQEVSKMVENIRFDMMEEERLLESGFTLEELAALSKLLGDIEEETVEKHVTSLEVQRLVWLVREQRLKRGITLGMIETIADRITHYYRERGFILAKAYIPEQKVRDGVVSLTLLLGELGDVSVNNNKLYKDKKIASVFKSFLGKPVLSSQIEEALFLINDFPGINVQGFFEPGEQVGDTKLSVNSRSEKRYDVNVRLDNHGSEQTGEYRLYAEGLLHNPLGFADQLRFAGLLAMSPNNTTYGQVRYGLNVFSPRLRLEAGASSNEFSLGPGNSESVNTLQIEGETFLQDVTATYKLKRSRKKNYSISLTQEEIASKIRLGIFPTAGDIGLDDEVRNTIVRFNFDVLQETRRILHQGSIKITTGEFLLGAEAGQDQRYWSLGGDYTFLTFWQPSYFEKNTRVISHVQMQVSGSALSSISQFSLGGPTQARAFPVSQFSGDDGLVLGLDWLLNAPKSFDFHIGDINLKDVLSPFVFSDVAYGRAKSLANDVEDSTAKLADIGIGLQMSYSKLKGNIQIALPVYSDFSSSELNNAVEDSPRLVFDMQYSFR